MDGERTQSAYQRLMVLSVMWITISDCSAFISIDEGFEKSWNGMPSVSVSDNLQ